MTAQAVVQGILAFGIYGWLLLQLRRKELREDGGLFWAYVASAAALEAFGWAVLFMFGWTSAEYRAVYYFAGTAHPVLQTAVLVDIWLRQRRDGDIPRWSAAVAKIAFLAALLSLRGAWDRVTVHALACQAEAFVLLLVLGRALMDGSRLPPLRGAILLGLGVGLALKTNLLGARLGGGEAEWRLGAQLSDLTPWLIWLTGVRRVLGRGSSPAGRAVAGARERIRLWASRVRGRRPLRRAPLRLFRQARLF